MAQRVRGEGPEIFARETNWETERARQEEKIKDLYTEIGRLSTQLRWLKKRASMLSRSERLALPDWEIRDIPIAAQVDLLGFNRS